MRDSRWVSFCAVDFSAGRFGVVRRLIASSTTATVSPATAAAIASSAVEPATAVSVVTMVSVSERSVVAARGPTSVASSAATGDKDDAYDHHDHDYRDNYQEHSHPNSPFTGYPTSVLQSTFGCTAVTTHR
jgi:hypothetical protein